MTKRFAKALARLRLRLKLQKDARDSYHAAQRQLELARGADMHPRAHLINAVQEAAAKLNLRNRNVDAQRAVVRRLKKGPRLSPDRTLITPNRSSRNGVTPRLIVLHITVSHNRPGMADVDGILSFFANPSVQASSHIVNDREGHDARCVPDGDKAWTQAAFNPQSLSIEQIEYSSGRTRQEWLEESGAQLENTAAWCAFWSHKYGIPLEQSTIKGVCEHRMLGAAGGGHSDCGPGYPLDDVIQRARQIKKARYGS